MSKYSYMKWILFLPQLPSSPSTLRVMVWRRMRAAGALGLQNGVWVLPAVPKHHQFAEDLLSHIKEQGANCYIFEVDSTNKLIENDIVDQFRADRDEDYVEFCEGCDALLAELEKETTNRKFTYAVLEETEEDLNKLEKWWVKISDRDFFHGKLRDETKQKLSKCREAHQAFAEKVYAGHGIKTIGQGGLS